MRFFHLALLFLLIVIGLVVWSNPNLLSLCNHDDVASRQAAVRSGQRREYLSRQHAVVLNRSRAKHAIIVDLLAGRLTLLQAGRQFKDLNETPITCQDDYRPNFPGRTDEEKVCRQVLLWLENELHERGRPQAEAIVQRFEDELRRHMACHGGRVVLPERAEATDRTGAND
jgi:hypothetical protein